MKDQKSTKQLQQTIKFYETLLRVSNDGILITDASQNIIEVNDTFCSFIGQNRRAVIESNLFMWLENFLDDAVEKWIHLERLVQSKQVVSNYEFQLSLNNEIRYLDVNTSLLEKIENEEQGIIISNWHDITERKKAEEFIRGIFESIGEGLVVVDRDYKIVTVNKTYCNQVKMPIKDIVGRHCYEVSHHIDKPCFMAHEECPARHTFTTGEPNTCIHTHYDKKGTPVYVKIRSYPMKDIPGNVISAIEVITDITKTHTLEKALHNKMEELQESEDRFRKISVTAQDAIIMMDNEGNISYWNPAAEKIFGYTEEEASGKYLHKLIVPDKFYETFLNGFKRFKDTGKGAAIGKRLELSAIKKDGTEFPVELSLSAVKIKDQWNAIGIVMDITERKQVEEALRASEDRYRSYIEVTGQLGWTTNADGEVEEDIPAWRRYTGQSEEELKGWGWSKALHSDDFEHTTQVWKKAVATKSIYETEYRVRRHDGIYRYFLARGVPVFNEDGSIREWVGTCIDITERKQAEEALKKAQAQLIQSEKMTAIGTLVAGVAHELSNPMMSIINFIEYCLKKTSTDDKRFAVLQDAERETDRCIAIVDNLLTFSHMEKEGEEEFQRESCTTILDRVFKLLSYRFEKERVQLTKQYAQNIPEIWMRENGIQQVFLNIITNALDAIKESEKKELYIDIHREGEYVKVTIADSGSGIAPEILPRIFDLFFTTKPPGQGTGLGLSISQSIVETHEGRITCESKAGQGVKFEILLPIKRKEVTK